MSVSQLFHLSRVANNDLRHKRQKLHVDTREPWQTGGLFFCAKSLVGGGVNVVVVCRHKTVCASEEATDRGRKF